MKEWYLTTPPPNIISTDITDDINWYAQDNFTDILFTGFSDNVILYNHDLSIGKEIKCIIQGNLADTHLKSMERTILVPIGILNGGDYIFFENSYWIVDGRPGNNKAYEKATLKFCQYKLKWQTNDGDIVERWCNITSASKYDVGENGNSIITLSSNNFTILIPHDELGHTIDGKRVFIDTSNNPHKVFKITRNDDTLFMYGDSGGIISLIADKTEFNNDTDRPDLLLCDYIDKSEKDNMSDNTLNISAEISGRHDLKVGYTRKYAVTFTNCLTGKQIDFNNIDFTWNVISDYEITINEYSNVIELRIDDLYAIDSSVLLQCVINGNIVKQIDITVLKGW